MGKSKTVPRDIVVEHIKNLASIVKLATAANGQQEIEAVRDLLMAETARLQSEVGADKDVKKMTKQDYTISMMRLYGLSQRLKAEMGDSVKPTQDTKAPEGSVPGYL